MSFAEASFSMGESKTPTRGTSAAFFYLRQRGYPRLHPCSAGSRSRGWPSSPGSPSLTSLLQLPWNPRATASLALNSFFLCRWYCSISACGSSLVCFSLWFLGLWTPDTFSVTDFSAYSSCWIPCNWLAMATGTLETHRSGLNRLHNSSGHLTHPPSKLHLCLH